MAKHLKPGRRSKAAGPAAAAPRHERRAPVSGLRSLFESHRLGYCCLDASGLVSMINAALLRWLGRPYLEVIGNLSFGDLLAPPDALAFDNAFAALQSQGWLRDFRAELVSQRGERLPIQVHLNVVRGAQGEFLRYDAVVLDDTERRRAEQVMEQLRERFATPQVEVCPWPEVCAPLAQANMALKQELCAHEQTETALRESEEKYHSVVTALSEGIIVLQADGAILYANLSAEHILGRSFKDLRNMAELEAHWQAIGEDGMPLRGAESPLRGALASGRAGHDFTMAIGQPDGRRCWISLNTEPLYRDGAVKPYGAVASFSDITARRELERHQALIQYAVDHASEGLARVGEDGRFLYVNEAACRLLGYSRDEMLALSVPDVDRRISPDDWPAHWARVGHHGEVMVETELKAKDGSIVPVELAISVQHAFGSSYHWTCVRDLSARRLSEAALQDSEERYRSVVRALNEGILLEAADGTILAGNPAAADILGVPQDRMVGMRTNASQWHTFQEDGRPMLPEERPGRRAQHSGQRSREVVTGLRRPDGSQIWLSVNAEPLWRPGAPTPYGVVCSFTDITARLQTERELKLTQFVVDHAGEGIAWIGQDGRYRYVNAEKCRLLGYSQEEFLRLKVSDIDLSFSAESWAEYWQHLRGPGPYRMQTIHRSKDGRRIPVELAITVAELDGTRYHCTFARDLSDYKRVEAELRQTAQHLREISRRLIDVEEQERRRLAVDLHDLIGSNLATLALYLKTLGDGLPPQNRATLQVAASLLQETIRNVRAITAELRPMAADYGGLLRGLQEYARQHQPCLGIEVRVIASCDELQVSGATELSLFRIVQEALHNSAKHAQARRVTIDLRNESGHVILSIADDGVGFDVAAVRRSGTLSGLGMVAMRERAEAIGWDFKLETAPGKGTCITLSSRV